MANISPAQPRRAETRLSSDAAAGEGSPEAYPLGYVEDASDPRTKLADIFNILLIWQARDLNNRSDLDRSLARHGNP